MTKTFEESYNMTEEELYTSLALVCSIDRSIRNGVFTSLFFCRKEHVHMKCLKCLTLRKTLLHSGSPVVTVKAFTNNSQVENSEKSSGNRLSKKVVRIS